MLKAEQSALVLDLIRKHARVLRGERLKRLRLIAILYVILTREEVVTRVECTGQA